MLKEVTDVGGPDHPVHRRAAHRRRRRRGRGRDGRRQHAQADAGPRRAALHRRHHPRRVPQAHREGRRPGAPLPAGRASTSRGRGHDLASCAACASATRCTTACASRTRALVAAAVLSNRYITDRFLPDKAIDLVDEAAAGCGWRSTRMPAELDEIDRRASCSWRSSARRCARRRTPPRRTRLETLEKELADLNEQRRRAEGRSGRREKEVVAAACRQSRERARAACRPEIEAAERAADYARAAELQYGRARRAGEAARRPSEERLQRADGTGRCCSRRRSTRTTSPRSSAAGPASPSSQLLEGEIEKLLHMEDRAARAASSARTRR